MSWMSLEEIRQTDSVWKIGITYVLLSLLASDIVLVVLDNSIPPRFL
jgi:hypothetical protein